MPPAIVCALEAHDFEDAIRNAVSLGVFLVLWMVDSLGYLLPDPFDQMVTNASLLAHFTPFATGALYLSDLGFFLSVVLFGLFLSVRALERR